MAIDRLMAARGPKGLGAVLGLLFFAVGLAGCSKEAVEQKPAEKNWTSLIDGNRAFADLKALADIGGISHAPDADARMRAGRALIKDRLKAMGFTNAEMKNQAFPQVVPLPGLGSDRTVFMENIVAVIPGKRPEAIAIAAHYDNKILANETFVGANDGASGVACALELARKLRERAQKEGPPPFSIYIVFFDGEEAFVDWQADYKDTPDHCYGSRKMASDKKNYPIEALILLDMIGDKDLNLAFEANSHKDMRNIFLEASKEFFGIDVFGKVETMLDDHISFKESGMLRVIDLIDFSYGPQNAYWHTKEDTVDKCSPRSLEKVGSLVLAALPKIEAWLAGEVK